MSQEQELSSKMPRPETWTTVLSEPAQSKCTWACQKSRFLQECSGKMPQAKIKENSCGRVCASLRDRNAFHLDMSQEQVYPTIYRKKTEPRWSDGTPRSSTGLNSHRKSPLVWTHCLGNKMPAASCSILQLQLGG